MRKIKSLPSEHISNYMNDLVALLRSTVDHGASIGWLAPLSKVEAQHYWLDIATQVETGDKILIVAQQDNRIVGLVQLALEPRDNGNHRAEVQKLGSVDIWIKCVK